MKLSKSLVVMMVLFAYYVPARASLNYSKKSAGGVALHILELNLQNEHIIPVSAGGMDYASKYYKDESFGAMAKRVGAVGAINGCYFDKQTLKPIGDVALDGTRLHNGGGWAYFGVKADGTFEFGTDNPVQSRVKWSDFQWGITCLPMVIRDGVVLINSNADLTAAGFRDSHVFMSMPRSALGETKDGKIVLVASGNTTFPSFAKALKGIGVVNAIGLDGGASTALYYNGKTILSPGRKLTTILAIVKGSAPVSALPSKEESVENEATTVNQPDESSNSVSDETTHASYEETPSSTECQDDWFKDSGFDCKTCKIAIKAMKDSGETAMANCLSSYCKKKFPNCK